MGMRFLTVMPGVVLAYILKIPFAIGAFVFGVSSVSPSVLSSQNPD